MDIVDLYHNIMVGVRDYGIARATFEKDPGNDGKLNAAVGKYDEVSKLVLNLVKQCLNKTT